MRGRETDPGTRKFRTSVLALATIAATALASYVQSCNAQRQAEKVEASVSATAGDVEKKAKIAESKAEQTEQKAEQTDAELAATYKALVEKMEGMDLRLDYTLKRIEFLENLLVRTSYHPSVRNYRPPSIPKSVAKPRPLPPDPATAVIQQEAAPTPKVKP